MQNSQSSSILSTQLQQDRMHLTIVHIFPSFYPLPDPKVLHDTSVNLYRIFQKYNVPKYLERNPINV